MGNFINESYYKTGIYYPQFGQGFQTPKGGYRYTSGQFKGMTFYNNGRVMDSNSKRMGIWKRNPRAEQLLTVHFNGSGTIPTKMGGQFNPATGITSYENNRAYNTRTKQKGTIDNAMNKTYFTPDNSKNYLGEIIGINPKALYGSNVYPESNY